MMKSLPLPLPVPLSLRLTVLLTVVFSGIHGCSSQKPDAATDSTVAPTADTAEAAVKSIIDGIDNGQANVAWEAMPSAYQNDVNGIVHDFANAMDPVLWTQVTGLLTNIQQLVNDKQEFIVNHPAVSAGPDPDAAKSAVPLIAGILKSILDAGSDLESLKSFDGAQYTKTTGAQLLTQAQALTALAPENAQGGPASLSRLKDVKVETVESTDSTATLKFTFPDGRTETPEFVKSDGKWLPQDMVNNWDANIAKAKSSIAGMPEQLTAMKGQVGMVLGAASGMLAPLQAATDQEQFNAAVNNLQGGIMGMMMMGGMGGQPPATPAAPPSAGPSGTQSSATQSEQSSKPVEEKATAGE